MKNRVDFESYLDYLSAMGRANGTIAICKQAMRSFKEANSTKKILNEPTEMQAITWIKVMRENGMKTITIKNYVMSVKRFYGYLKKRGKVNTNVFEELGAELPSGKKQTIRPYKNTDEIIKLIRGTFNIRDRAVIILLAKAGLREGELVALDLEDGDLEKGIMMINKHIDKITNKIMDERKNREHTAIPLDDETIRALKYWIAVRPKTTSKALFVSCGGLRLSVRDVNYIIDRWVERTGIHNNGNGGGVENRITPQYFRAWFTRMMQRNGCDPDVLDYIRGDKAASMRSYYGRQVLDFDEIKRVYLKTAPKFGI